MRIKVKQLRFTSKREVVQRCQATPLRSMLPVVRAQDLGSFSDTIGLNYHLNSNLLCESPCFGNPCYP
jgi:hypothetical protein